MTTEVIIANAQGIALAADSTVTIGNSKTYNSAIKLFSASKVEPVGIMTYGNATIFGIPWEIIIKQFRQLLGATSFPLLEDYAYEFINYLKNQLHILPKDAIEQWHDKKLSDYLQLHINVIDNEILNSGYKIDSITNELLNLISINCFKNELVALEGHSLSEGFTTEFEDDFKNQYFELFLAKINEFFPYANSELKTLIFQCSTLIFTRSFCSSSTSGIVIAGYGINDIFPSIITYELEGVVLGHLKYSKIIAKSRKLLKSNEVSILPFGQEDMVEIFMNGISRELKNHYVKFVTDFIKNMTQPILSTSQDQHLKNLIKAITEPSTYLNALNMASSNYHMQPVVDMVSFLPKNELANMAEILVNLTAFKRKVTDSIETVGGPVDVAVISKGDGLVWVKRKHYFPPELNQHFFTNYFRGL